MLVAARYIFLGVLGLLFNLLYWRLLFNYGGVDILEQLRELDHLAFNLLDSFVAALDSAKSGLRLTTTIRLQ